PARSTLSILTLQPSMGQAFCTGPAPFELVVPPVDLSALDLESEPQPTSATTAAVAMRQLVVHARSDCTSTPGVDGSSRAAASVALAVGGTRAAWGLRARRRRRPSGSDSPPPPSGTRAPPTRRRRRHTPTAAPGRARDAVL